MTHAATPEPDGGPEAGRGWSGWYLGLLTVVLVLVTLGPALLTSRVFLGVDQVSQQQPWRSEVATGFSADTQCIGDTIDAVYPGREYVAEGVRGGVLREWNPYISGGAAVGALPDLGVFTPQGLPYLVLPASVAPEVGKLVEMVLSLGGMTLFLRRLRLRTAAAVLGGVVYTTSGFLVVWTGWPQAGVAATLPWAFWAVERFLDRRTVRSVLPLTLVVALLLLGGFPAVTGYGLYLLGAYTLVRLLVRQHPDGVGLLPRARAGVQPVLLLAGAVVLGVGLTMVQLLPFATNLSTLDLDARSVGAGDHLPLYALATAVWPNILGSCTTGPGVIPYFGLANQIESSVFVGGAALVLAVWGAARRGPGAGPRGVRAFFVGTAVVAVVLGFVGGDLLGLASQLPVFSNNYVGRIRVVVGFALAVLAALGFDALLRRPAAADGPVAALVRASWRRRLVVLAVPLVTAAVLYRAGRDALALAGPAVERLPGLSLSRGLLLPTVLLAVAVLLCLLAWWGPRLLRLVALVLLPALVVAQGAMFAGEFWPEPDGDLLYPRTAVHAYLEAELGHDRFASQGDVLLASTATVYRLRSVAGHSFTQQAYQDLLTAIEPAAFVSRTYSRLPGGLAVTTSPLLDRMAAAFYVADPGAPVLGLVLAAPEADGSERVLREGAPLLVPLPPDTALRAVAVTPARPVPTETLPFARMVAEVLDPAGRVVVSGSRRLLTGPSDQRYPVALAGESLAEENGPLTLRLSLVDAPGVEVPLTAAAGVARVDLVVPPPLGDGLRVVETTGAVVYERLASLPRIRWASDPVVTPDPAERLALLGSGALTRDQVVLSAPPPADVAGAAGARAGTAGLRVLTDTGDLRRVAVDARTDGLLVVADALAPGFTATLDGRPVPLLEADHAFMAVAVPAGEHLVEVRYSAPGLSAGTVVSLGSLLVLAIVTVLASTGRRVRPRGPRHRA